MRYFIKNSYGFLSGRFLAGVSEIAIVFHDSIVYSRFLTIFIKNKDGFKSYE